MGNTLKKVEFLRSIWDLEHWKTFVFRSHLNISTKIVRKIIALIHLFSQLIYICEAFERKEFVTKSLDDGNVE